MNLRERMNKRCPRCKTKTAYTTVICPGCQLNYQKFEQATNKEAKIQLKQGEKEQVLMRKGCPVDVKKWKLILLAVFLGFVGAHHYYVGRTKMGLFYTLSLVFYLLMYAVVAIISPIIYVVDLYYICMLTWGAVLFMWIIDVAKICVNHYKIPVSRLF